MNPNEVRRAIFRFFTVTCVILAMFLTTKSFFDANPLDFGLDYVLSVVAIIAAIVFNGLIG